MSWGVAHYCCVLILMSVITLVVIMLAIMLAIMIVIADRHHTGIRMSECSFRVYVWFLECNCVLFLDICQEEKLGLC